MAMLRQHFYYSGHVQGVGFRYNALRCARACDVTGYVKNLPDGRVELVVEAESREVHKLTEEIKRTMGGNIREITIQQHDAEGEFTEFSIRD